MTYDLTYDDGDDDDDDDDIMTIAHSPQYGSRLQAQGLSCDLCFLAGMSRRYVCKPVWAVEYYIRGIQYSEVARGGHTSLAEGTLVLRDL